MNRTQIDRQYLAKAGKMPMGNPCWLKKKNEKTNRKE